MMFDVDISHYGGKVEKLWVEEEKNGSESYL